MLQNVSSLASWLVLAPGKTAICRFPVDTIPTGCRLATAAELLAANQGRPFPWGYLPENKMPTTLWEGHRIGTGGLIHNKWFVTSEGRFGGAPNVPQTLPGSLRCCLLLDGGNCNATLEENEGYAVVREVDQETTGMYRQVQLHAAEHVAADGGAIIVTPLDEGIVRVGFVGRCMICPNPELISFRQLTKAVPDYQFELLPEWKNWQLKPAQQTPKELVGS